MAVSSLETTWKMSKRKYSAPPSRLTKTGRRVLSQKNALSRAQAAEVPWPQCSLWQRWQQMEPKIIDPHLPYKILKLLHTEPTALSHSFVISPGWSDLIILYPHPPCFCTKAGYWQPPENPESTEQLLYLVPLNQNYSFSRDRNANVIANFLNKQYQHCNNHQDFS